MQLPFVGGAYTSRSPNLNAQTCINFFPAIDNQEAKNVISLFGTPGSRLFSELIAGTGHVVRGALVVGDYCYVVVDDSVYQVNSLGVGTLLGTISTSTGRVELADNSIEVMIVDGTISAGRIDLTTFVLTTVTLSFKAISITFQDGFFIAVEKDTRQFYISAPNDGTSWDPADVATVEGRSSNLLKTISNTQDLWFLGKSAVEVYYDSGNASFPFERIGGALIDVGCGAEQSPCKINGLIYWLTDLGRVCVNSGYSAVQFVSTPHIDYIFSTYGPIDDAIGFSVTVDGHAWYVLVFPTLRKTWVFDTTTKYWFEWQSYYGTEDWARHRSNCAVQFGRDFIFGDYDNGSLFTLDMKTFTDNLRYIRRQRAGQTISKDRNDIIHHRFEIEFESGVGLDGDVQGSDPQAVLDWSDDGGHTWSNQYKVSVGKIGEFGVRAQWRRLGMSRNRVYRVTVSDPVKWVILGAYAQLEECTA